MFENWNLLHIFIDRSLNKFLLFILGILLLEVFIFTLQKHLMPHVGMLRTRFN